MTVGKELHLSSDQGQASTVLADVILSTAESSQFKTNKQTNKKKTLKNVFDETLNIILFNLTLECISFNILGIHKAILLPTNVTAVLREKHICRWQAKLVTFLMAVLLLLNHV